ncbi:uncharacterized protein Z518_05829 [Rhinocladiella mackenziei CBS 650.93]|uniref:Rhinocladiella mackenziei CBS 650.93 unplaced genomic scaffold supercont1.4, whole genome shotgun sequence n=1 Tax=Rhinocladiella mackenziei CBS 650.93 TaxID=1442369 RepID=A0A0D2FS39_9EURO|nr:uncharacterized protein Z518_05829 [Rhinocladiella mackenziei CBS 650.93]KIX04957.1 hypothetical protein Z518_05829 [Rhinocladiella mackenziei CBS 650.93]
MADSDTGINEPLLPPFQQITSNNRGPISLATAITLVVITSLTVAVKLWTRLSTTRTLGLNDLAIIFSLSCALGQTISLCLAVNDGLGQHVTDIAASEISDLSKKFYASNILLVLALTGAKASVTLLIIAIKPLKSVVIACYGMLVFVGVWGVASVFVLAFQCFPNRWVLGPDSGLGNNTCIDQYAMQVAIRSLDIASDVGIVLLPILMMQKVQVAPKKRLVVMALFGLRIATPILTAITILSLDDFYHSTPQDRPWNAITPAIWTSVALNVSIVTACIPSIKRFLADWAAGLSGVVISEPFELEHSAGKTNPSGTYIGGSGMGSKIATKLGLSSTSKAEITSTRSLGDMGNQGAINLETRPRNGGRKGQVSHDTSESVKGLTDGVIMHSIDYRVEFEDQHPGNRNGSCSSSARDRSDIR